MKSSTNQESNDNFNTHSNGGGYDIPPGYGGLVKEPNVNDVLSGRGGRINSHPGNVHFRLLVNQHKHVYLSKQTKKLEKVKVADKIVQAIRNMVPAGRFLKEDPATQQWIEIGDKKARKKAGQAMRENAEETRKELAENETADDDVTKTDDDVISDEANGGNMSSILKSDRSANSSGDQNNYGPWSNFATSAVPGGGHSQQQNRRQYDNFPSYGNETPPNAPSNNLPQQYYFNTLQQQTYGQNPFGNQMFQNANVLNCNSNSPLQQTSRISSNMADHSNIYNAARLGAKMNETLERESLSFHGSPDTSGSRVNSNSTSGHGSTKRSSDSSILSFISSGLLSQNELLYLATQQHQQQQQQQPYSSRQMTPLNEGLEWNDGWDQTISYPSNGGLSNATDQYRKLDGYTETTNNNLGTESGQIIKENDRRRWFQQHREQSQLSLSANGAEKRVPSGEYGHHAIRESQIIKESFGSLGSMMLDPNVNMSSMGMGSTSAMMSMYAGTGNRNVAVESIPVQQGPTQNMAMTQSSEVGPNAWMNAMNARDQSLMNVLAEAASQSEKLISHRDNIPSVYPTSPYGTSSSAGHGHGNFMHGIAMDTEDHEIDMNRNHHLTDFERSHEPSSLYYPQNKKPQRDMMVDASLQTGLYTQQRISGDPSYLDLSYHQDFSRFGGGRRFSARGGINDPARRQSFLGVSARSFMSDLSENMSALDLASLDNMTSRRDSWLDPLFLHLDSRRRESVTQQWNLFPRQDSNNEDAQMGDG